MAYEDLTAMQMLRYATTVPDRTQCKALHDYVRDNRVLVDGMDELDIPTSHKGHMRAENHEGSQRLNTRIRQLAAWLAEADVRFSLQASGPGQSVQTGASVQERFARRGDQLLSRGTGLHNWRHESMRDLSETGVAVIEQHPTRDYYTKVQAEPDRMAKGARLDEVVIRRRIDPATWSWQEDDLGKQGLTVISGTRTLGELANEFGLEETEKLHGFFDFSLPTDPDGPDSSGEAAIETAEVWGGNNAGLVIMGGPKPTRAFNASTVGRVLATWTHTFGKPPFYPIVLGPWPWHSPLDEMVQLTNTRNYYESMLDIQTGGAIFRHWQLIDDNTGDDITFTPRNTVPETIRFDLSEPPPHMGPGTHWEVAPFEFHDVTPRYQQIVAQHENAGASVARLMGQSVNQNTAVGTADFMDDAARREFGPWLEQIEGSIAEQWSDLFRWHRRFHKDPLFVADQRRDPESGLTFLNVALELKAEDIATEDVTVRLDTRSRLGKFADFRFAVEAISNGFMDYDRAVEQGLIPGIDDPELEKLMIALGEAERLVIQAKLQAIQQAMAQNQGSAPDPSTAGRFLEGTRTDPRGTGTERGPNNISDSALAAGATDIARSA